LILHVHFTVDAGWLVGLMAEGGSLSSAAQSKLLVVIGFEGFSTANQAEWFK